jgi:hypothetical protein
VHAVETRGLAKRECDIMNPPDLEAVAKRVVWFKAPEDTIRDEKKFI